MGRGQLWVAVRCGAYKPTRGRPAAVQYGLSGVDMFKDMHIIYATNESFFMCDEAGGVGKQYEITLQGNFRTMHRRSVHLHEQPRDAHANMNVSIMTNQS